MSDTQIDRPTYGHLGRKVAFAALPAEVQRCVRRTYIDLWDLADPAKGT